MFCNQSWLTPREQLESGTSWAESPNVGWEWKLTGGWADLKPHAWRLHNEKEREREPSVGGGDRPLKLSMTKTLIRTLKKKKVFINQYNQHHHKVNRFFWSHWCICMISCHSCTVVCSLSSTDVFFKALLQEKSSNMRPQKTISLSVKHHTRSQGDLSAFEFYLHLFFHVVNGCLTAIQCLKKVWC